MKNQKPIVAVTLGDAAGISPEVVAQALGQPRVRQICRPVVIGDAEILLRAAEVTRVPLKPAVSACFEDLDFTEPAIPVLQNEETTVGDFEVGRVQANCGRAFVAAIEWSARLALEGKVQAIASAPTNKESMHAAGYHYTGQTDIYAEIAGVEKYFTILTGGKLRLFLLSSHVSLAQAIELVTRERILEVGEIADRALRELWGIDAPRIAVAGLNPHAGDGGLFGREEIERITPAIQALRDQGKRFEGPFPSDSLLHRAESGVYDGVVVMYHDQGVIPLKKHGYITVIAGTPFIRTTAGHGTAYDIAWQGKADGRVMARAIETAAELANLKP
jgi:4-hydroxythreonine-4-phosphate dehydrogenase